RRYIELLHEGPQWPLRVGPNLPGNGTELTIQAAAERQPTLRTFCVTRCRSNINKKRAPRWLRLRSALAAPALGVRCKNAEFTYDLKRYFP
ncbi:hypothetical protein, partial [Marinobacterium halophilum]|uniref:hypothetical protein n=1 Tax=Marinobacterium halophilum TaxID=267374 RepID=UPI001B8018F7